MFLTFLLIFFYPNISSLILILLFILLIAKLRLLIISVFFISFSIISPWYDLVTLGEDCVMVGSSTNWIRSSCDR
ncbi:hypothetical protein ES332_D05G390900v1 [Gossypium tomentosum]|uniref:Uncharacterized protein n=1 Tax=Gossypium tomentosum TaxID=34277 RepID=A0A5D2L5G2_GOSTO|nr:hypothetical protein ES332_D05G390900v1 [Gossypium tomentosum]